MADHTYIVEAQFLQGGGLELGAIKFQEGQDTQVLFDKAQALALAALPKGETRYKISLKLLGEEAPPIMLDGAVSDPDI